jgi:hypothetical protein
VRVLATGADIALDRTLIWEALVWFAFHMVVQARVTWLAMIGRRGPAIWFEPHRPRPWYLVWSALAWSGGRVARSPAEADATFAFEDSTWSAPNAAPGRVFNRGCPDVSKSEVAKAFAQVFGYPLAIDPAVWIGAAVEKSERNGAHDGAVVQCPTPARPGRHYQRLIDTSDGRFVHDLRTPCVGGKPVAVWIKRKPHSGRFSIHNVDVTMRRPEEVFSRLELDRIGAFLAAMQIDWAGLDILRNRQDGRIYIVDVNKTDVGPIIALPLREKVRGVQALADALVAMVRPSRA